MSCDNINKENNSSHVPNISRVFSSQSEFIFDSVAPGSEINMELNIPIIPKYIASRARIAS